MSKSKVRFGAKNDGPKEVEFDSADDAKAFAAEVGGRVVTEKATPRSAPAKPETK